MPASPRSNTASRSVAPGCGTLNTAPPLTRESNRLLGIDRVINPDHLTALDIVRLLKMPAATYVESFAKGKVTLVRAKVDPASSVVGLPLSEADFGGCLVAAIERDESLSIPNGDSVIQPGDKVFLVGHPHNFSSIGYITGREVTPAKNVVIVGGGKLGLRVAHMLTEKGHEVSIR